MMNPVAQIFQHHKELAVFLAIALGFLIGRIKIGSFVVGSMLGSLIAGLIVGQMQISVPPTVKLIFFDLFLFATGYKVGPQFFYGLKKNAWTQIVLTLVICVACLLTTYFISILMGYDPGTSAGLLAGAFSESTVVGTAADAIQNLSVPEELKNAWINNIPVAYAVTYVIGSIGNVWFLSHASAKILRFNLKEEAKKLSKTIEAESSNLSAEMNAHYREWIIRAFILDGGPWNGRTISEIESSIPGARIIIERIRIGNEILEPAPQMVLKSGDTVVLAARKQVMTEKLLSVGKEVFDKELFDFPMEKSSIIVTQKGIDGKTLKEIAEQYAHGVMLEKLIRAGEEMPFAPETEINFADTLAVYGRVTDVQKAADALGFKEKKGSETDLIFVCTGILIGGLFGMLSLKTFGITLTLGTSGGALVSGLFFGWIHSRRPAIGKIPGPALWLMDNMGLAAFLALVGLAAGPSFLPGLEHTGYGILVAGIVVGIFPHVVGLLTGHYLLKMNPVIQLGAQTGAGTSTTALKALQDAAASKLPVLGYTIPYALGNILLTAWGPVIVSLMTRHTG